jgi:hypothetical protein
MSKPLQRLRKLELAAFRDWNRSARECVELRNAAIAADLKDAAEKHTLFTFACMRTQQAWDRWQSLATTVEELEEENRQHHGENGA